LSTTTAAPALEFGPILRAMKRNKVRFGLIMVEIALTLAIVANCVSMILDARREMARRSGFDDANLLSIRSTPFDPAFREDGYLDNSLRQDLEALRSVPGVRVATNTFFLPWQGGGSSTELRASGTKGEWLRTQIYAVDEHGFDALGAPITAGRNFTADEVESSAAMFRALRASARPRGADGLPAQKITQDVVITEAYGRLAFGGNGPFVGHMLEDNDGDFYQIIGTIDAFYNPYGWPIHEYAVFYTNKSRSYEGGAPYLVRVEPGQGEAVAKAVEQKLLAVNGGRNLRVRTITEIKGQFFGSKRLVASMMSGLILLLVFVTSLGIVGLTAFSVAERTRQIGTRRALGARRTDILRHFLLENWMITTLGLALGVLLAYGLNVGLVNTVAGARMAWPLLAVGVTLLWLAGLAATFVPALRAARISPAVATRNV
jgi:putative ABC transport system permease protein